MPRGGKRSTSFVNTWKHGETRTIRVPVALADDVLKYARKLDEGKSKAPYVSAVLERFVEHQRNKYGKNNAQKGEFSTDGSRWYYLNEFRKWAEGIEDHS